MNYRNFALSGLAAALIAAAAPAVAPAAAPSAAAAAAPAPAKRFVPTRFSVVVKGSGPDVILIPGLTASRNVWNSTVASVPGYRYHLVQVAGFAGSPAGPNAKGAIVAPVAEEISRYIAANGLNRPALVGHSMGGTLAMMVAARHPAQVGKVMVVDMLPQPAGLLGSSAAGMKGLAESLRNLSSTAGGRRLVESMIGMFGHPSDAKSRSDTDVVTRATHELALVDLTPELPRIRAPLTVLYASQDDRSRAAADQAYASAYAPRRGARLVRVDGSGHMIMYDQPERFRSALRTFLAN